MSSTNEQHIRIEAVGRSIGANEDDNCWLVNVSIQRPQRIQAFGSSDEATGAEKCWLADVALEYDLVREAVRVFDPFTTSQAAECRWYLENYASQDPFESERASKVAESIRMYASQLHGQLLLDGVFEPQELGLEDTQTMKIDIVDSVDAKFVGKSMHVLHWELLEQTLLWPENFDKITVRRIVPKTTGLVPDNGGSRAEIKSSTSQLNILLVIARDTTDNSTKYRDVNPFETLKVLLALQKSLKLPYAQTRLNVQVVRPSTYEALRQLLERSTECNGKGYFHVVHFDVHGRVATRRLTNGDKVPTAWLDFASSKPSSTTLKPVPADEVARLLFTHGIHCSVLNACNSARADKGLAANLAATFVAGGISDVLAMSYEFSGSLVTPFFESFYSSLFICGSEFSKAANDARLLLIETKQRKARLRMEVDVCDWFIPVTYSSGFESQLKHQAIESQLRDLISLPALEVEVPSQITALGRDYDMLELERMLMGSNNIFIHGPSGVGKSVFMHHAFDIWKRTSFFERCSFVDLAPMPGKGHPIPAKIESQIVEDFQIVSLDQLRDERLLPVSQTWSYRSLLVIDNIEETFNKCFSQGLEPVKEVVTNILRKLGVHPVSSTNPARTKIILIGIGEKEWWNERFSYLSGEFFPLKGLDLSASLNLAESILGKTGFQMGKTRTSTDYLVHTVNLLQRNPFALEIGLRAAVKALTPSSCMEEIFRVLHIGEVNIGFGVPGRGMQTDIRFMLSLETIFDRFPEYQDELCSLADFWGEGPLHLTTYFRRVASYAGLHHEYNHEKLILCLNELGGWRVIPKEQVEWIHPLLTLYLRQRRRTHVFKGPPLWAKGVMKVADFLGSNKREDPFGSKPSLLRDIPRHFIAEVAIRDKGNTLVNALLGLSGPKAGETMRLGLFNLFATFDLITRPDSPVPSSAWPTDLLFSYLPPSRLILSLPEQELLTAYVDATLTLLNKNNGGLAVPSSLRILAFNLVVHLMTSAALGGVYNKSKMDELLALALAMLEASEATYGPCTGDELMWKGMMYRFDAIEALRRKDEEAADAAWEKMKAAEIECFGPSIHNQPLAPAPSQSKSFISTPTEALAGFQSAVASWAPVRHAAWPWLKERILRGDDPNAIDRMYLPSIEGNFENMMDTQKATGASGLDYEGWKRYFPPRNDIDDYIHKLEDPDAIIQGLETAKDTGDWKVAAQAHSELLKRAAAGDDTGKTLMHLGELMEIMQESGADNEQVERLQIAKKIAEISKRSEELGGTTDLECLEIVEGLQNLGHEDPAQLWRAGGTSEEEIEGFLDAADRARRSRERSLEMISLMFERAKVTDSAGQMEN